MQTLWLRTEADPATADRYADALVRTFATLASASHIGTPIATDNPELAELRKWRVDGFRNFLLFYVPTGNGVRIVRVLHAAQDWLALLNAD